MAGDREATLSRRVGGLKLVRDGVRRVDVQLPRGGDEPRRRVSRTVKGTSEVAERALAGSARSLDRSRQRKARHVRWTHGVRRARSLQGKTVRGRVATRTGPMARGSRGRSGPGHREASPPYADSARTGEQAEVELADSITVDGGELPVSTSARTLRAACDLYLLEARTESQTQRTDRSACRRICATVLPGGAMPASSAVEGHLARGRGGLRQMGGRSDPRPLPGTHRRCRR